MRHIFLIASLFLAIATYGQAPNKATLHGSIIMATGEQFPYRIEITETNGIVTGFAYTYDERDEAKTIIKGKLDRTGRKLSFKETEIVKSSLVTTQAFMCMVQATLDYKGGKLSGPAINKQLDNTACTDGTIEFTNKNEIEDLFSTHDPYDVEIKMGEKKTVPDTPQPQAAATNGQEPVSDKITAGVEKSYEWHSDSVVMEVWDAGYFDGDMVTIYLDDKPVLNKYIILKQKKVISVALPATGVHTIAILAENEGSDPPNTATLSLLDGNLRYNIMAYNNKGDRSLIRVRRVSHK